MTAEHMLTDHLDAAADPNLHIENPHLHKTIENSGQYQPAPIETKKLTINVNAEPEKTGRLARHLRDNLEKQLNQVYTYDNAIYALNILETRSLSPTNMEAKAEITAYLKNLEHKEPEKDNTMTDLADKLEQRVKNWADTYDDTSSYTLGKKVGAMHAVHLLRKIQEEENEDR